MSNSEKFHLGITMAGAVSAGAYTAGFIDYLFEVLEIWEVQKKGIREKIKNGVPLDAYEQKIPMHEVCIDALGGASAGGIVGVMAALATYGSLNPVKEPTNQRTGNILYDSWVLMDDDLDKGAKNEDTFIKMLATGDMDGNLNGIPSLLNSEPIDKIADRVFDNLVPKEQQRKRPDYISNDLRVLVSLCSLRGVPFELKFENILSVHFPHSPGHRMNEHMVVAHFKMKYDEALDKDIYLDFDPYNKSAKELLKLCTLATGAFPIGLAPRHFKEKITTKYLKNCLLRNLDVTEAEKDAIDFKLSGDYFDFTDVDGGTINNEPYAEVVQVLEELHPNYNPKKPMFGTIMIDPFPNFYNQDEAKPIQDTFPESLFQKNFWSVIPKLYTTLREQVRVKHSGSFYKDYLRLLVFPIKWEKNGVLKNHPPLSCAALGGFGGFLDIEFRKHDFFLGRNNARNFLRAFFMLKYDKTNPHPLFEDITLESINVFARRIDNEKGKEVVYLPIIPDLYLIQDKLAGQTNPFHYTMDTFPKIKEGYFDKIKPFIKRRIGKILTVEIDNRFDGNWMLRNALKLVKGYISGKLTAKVITIMEDGFKDRKMF